MRLITRGCIVLALAAGALTGCFSDRPEPSGPSNNPPPVSGSASLTIDNFAFVPPRITVTVGTTLTWTNRDATLHTVSSTDGSTFDSGAFNQGQTFQFVASTPGTYAYFCRIHPFMKGTVTVTP
ncbi:MAG TPA: cupredoxin family copper-binding protein [Gemmatimonadales bacterium]|nr:cupredoxin family copper-binding protein [Gemmatimonadales bacterium]